MANKLKKIELNAELSSIVTRILVLNARIATEGNKSRLADLEIERLELKEREASLRTELASLTDFAETDAELRGMETVPEGRR